jgi:hypothetical protein
MLAAEVLSPRGIDVTPLRELDQQYRSEAAVPPEEDVELTS